MRELISNGNGNGNGKRLRVGLALSGGAARGAAHVGVIKALLSHNIPIDVIAGTSAGALVGGAFASGVSVEELEEIGRNIRWRDMGRVTLSRLGIQSNARLEHFVRSRFPCTKFEELPIPFAAVATDLHTGGAVIMKDEGDLAFAIRASCALPGWYVPVVHPDGRQLVDGGLVANVPSAVARSLGADIVIAVDVNWEGAKFWSPPTSVVGVILQAMMVIQRTAVEHQVLSADVVVMPRVGHIRWDEMTRAEELIAAGHEAALEKVEKVKELLYPQAQLPEPQEKRARWYHSIFKRNPTESDMEKPKLPNAGKQSELV
jgi:NTE family protein